MNSTISLKRTVDIDPNPDKLTFLPIDPFAARRNVASRIAGLGGNDPSDDPSYVFQSLEIFPVLGPVRFTLHFHALLATQGTLVVQIHAISIFPGTSPMLVKTIAVPLNKIVEQDGFVEVGLISRRNMVYTIGGSINDETDASGFALSLSLDPRERQASAPCSTLAKVPAPVPAVVRVDKLLQRPELATMRPPVLARPVSQAMTARQARDPLVSAWNTALHQTDSSINEDWENAFILQALHYYGIPTSTGSGLGIARQSGRLPAYLAGRGCTILAAATHLDDLPDGDPGLALEHFAFSDLCSPLRFFEAVHLTVFKDLTIPIDLAGFDFLWSIDASSGTGARDRFPQMVRDSIGCLKLGGIAIHMLRYSGEIGASAKGQTSYGRAEIERMALSLIADGQEVAQLKFDVDTPDRPGDYATPFALIGRRIR